MGKLAFFCLENGFFGGSEIHGEEKEYLLYEFPGRAVYTCYSQWRG